LAPILGSAGQAVIVDFLTLAAAENECNLFFGGCDQHGAAGLAATHLSVDE